MFQKTRCYLFRYIVMLLLILGHYGGEEDVYLLEIGIIIGLLWWVKVCIPPFSLSIIILLLKTKQEESCYY